jgi:hypothetical protein
MLPDEIAINKDGGIDISVVIPSYNHALYIAEAIDKIGRASCRERVSSRV